MSGAQQKRLAHRHPAPRPRRSRQAHGKERPRPRRPWATTSSPSSSPTSGRRSRSTARTWGPSSTSRSATTRWSATCRSCKRSLVPTPGSGPGYRPGGFGLFSPFPTALLGASELAHSSSGRSAWSTHSVSVRSVVACSNSPRRPLASLERVMEKGAASQFRRWPIPRTAHLPEWARSYFSDRARATRCPPGRGSGFAGPARRRGPSRSPSACRPARSRESRRRRRYRSAASPPWSSG